MPILHPFQSRLVWATDANGSRKVMVLMQIPGPVFNTFELTTVDVPDGRVFTPLGIVGNDKSGYVTFVQETFTSKVMPYGTSQRILCADLITPSPQSPNGLIYEMGAFTEYSNPEVLISHNLTLYQVGLNLYEDPLRDSGYMLRKLNVNARWNDLVSFRQRQRSVVKPAAQLTQMQQGVSAAQRAADRANTKARELEQRLLQQEAEKLFSEQQQQRQQQLAVAPEITRDGHESTRRAAVLVQLRNRFQTIQKQLVQDRAANEKETDISVSPASLHSDITSESLSDSEEELNVVLGHVARAVLDHSDLQPEEAAAMVTAAVELQLSDADMRRVASPPDAEKIFDMAAAQMQSVTSRFASPAQPALPAPPVSPPPPTGAKEYYSPSTAVTSFARTQHATRSIEKLNASLKKAYHDGVAAQPLTTALTARGFDERQQRELKCALFVCNLCITYLLNKNSNSEHYLLTAMELLIANGLLLALILSKPKFQQQQETLSDSIPGKGKSSTPKKTFSTRVTKKKKPSTPNKPSKSGEGRRL